ncbi:MAG: hypothetical protein MJ060_01955 [Clostridia bacterium]|nr:hypothetical protein [Clostridia bacterium]
MGEIKQEEKNQNSHSKVLDKIKKTISAVILTGILASPAAARGMKEQATYNETTRVERNMEQVSAEQAICNDAMKLFGNIIGSDLPISNDSVLKENGIKGIMFEILDRPELAASGKTLISEKVKNMCEILPNTCGSEPAKEAWIYMFASIDGINERINRLEKFGYKFNETSLKPQKNIQQQADLGIGR